METSKERHCIRNDIRNEKSMKSCLELQVNPALSSTRRERCQTLNCESWINISTEEPENATATKAMATASKVPKCAEPISTATIIEVASKEAQTGAMATNTRNIPLEILPRKERKVLTMWTETMSYKSYHLANKNTNNSMSNNNNHAVMTASHSLNFLKSKVTPFARGSRECRHVNLPFVGRFYQGLVLMYLICGINGQNSSVHTTLLPSSSINISSVNTAVNSDMNSSSFTPNMTSSIHVASAITISSVNTSIVPSPTQSLSANITSTNSNVHHKLSSINLTSNIDIPSSPIMTSSSINMTSSSRDTTPLSINMTSSAIEMASSSISEISFSMQSRPSFVNMTSSQSVTIALSSVNVTSSYAVITSSTLNVTDVITPSSAQALNITKAIAPPSAQALNVTKAIAPSSAQALNVTSRTSSMMMSSASSSGASLHSSVILHSNVSSVSPSPQASSVAMTTPSITTQISTTVLTNATNFTSSIFQTRVTSVIPSSPVPHPDITSNTSIMASPTLNSTIMIVHVSTPVTSIIPSSSVHRPDITSNTSIMASPTLNSTIMLGEVSNSTSALVPTPVITKSVNSSVYLVNMTLSSILLTASPIQSTAPVSTSYVNVSAMFPLSTSYMNASEMSISPSMAVSSSTSRNYSATFLNATVMSYVSMTSSVNYSTLSPSSTMMVMNASSSVSQGPTPNPSQGIRTLDVNVKIINEPFVPELNNKNSDVYRNLSTRVIQVFQAIFSPLPGFRQLTVERFREGSVVVDMKANFNASSNVTTTQVKDEIISHNATNNTQSFIFSQGLAVKDQCTAGFCVNGGPCMTNATLSAFCNCPLGFTGVRCDKVIVSGGYSSWSTFSDCSKSCKGGEMRRTRTCTNPAPQNGGKDCSSLGASYEEKECNSDVLCPEIWAIIGVCCFLFLLLLILLIVCCIKKRNKDKKNSSTTAITGSQMNIVPLEIMVYDAVDPKERRSPDGISNPEFINESETEEDDIYKKQLLLFLKQSHLIKPGMVLSYGDDISDYSNSNSRKASAVSVESDEEDDRQNVDQPKTSEL